MSAHCSEATTCAGTGSSPRNSTVMSSIVWTTCAAVATFPFGEISTPEPISLNLTRPVGGHLLAPRADHGHGGADAEVHVAERLALCER